MKHTLTKTVLTVCLWASVGVAIVSAQQTPAQGDAPAEGDSQRMEQGGQRGRRGGGREQGGMRGGELGFLRQLNLTDAQQQQLRAFQEEHAQATKTQRGELHQLFQVRRQGGEFTAEQEARARELRQQLGESTKSLRDRISGILTPEQRTEAEQMMKEHQSRRDERRQRRVGQGAPDNQ
jgi:protein CpxP